MIGLTYASLLLRQAMHRPTPLAFASAHRPFREALRSSLSSTHLWRRGLGRGGSKRCLKKRDTHHWPLLPAACLLPDGQLLSARYGSD
jgi:hypothetical protein